MQGVQVGDLTVVDIRMSRLTVRKHVISARLQVLWFYGRLIRLRNVKVLTFSLSEVYSMLNPLLKNQIASNFKPLYSWYSWHNLLYGSIQNNPEVVAKFVISLLLFCHYTSSDYFGCFRRKDYVMNIMNLGTFFLFMSWKLFQNSLYSLASYLSFKQRSMHLRR